MCVSFSLNPHLLCRIVPSVLCFHLPSNSVFPQWETNWKTPPSPSGLHDHFQKPTPLWTVTCRICLVFVWFPTTVHHAPMPLFHAFLYSLVVSCPPSEV